MQYQAQKNKKRDAGNLTRRVAKDGTPSYKLQYRAHDEFGQKRICSKTVRGLPGETESKLLKRAESALRAALKSVEDNEHIIVRELKLKEFSVRWLSEFHAPNVSAKSLERSCEKLEHYILPFLGDISLQRLKPEMIQRLLTKLRTQGRRKGGGPLSERSVLGAFRTLSHMLGDATRVQLIKSNPCLLVKAPRCTANHSRNADGEEIETIQALDREALGVLFRGLEKYHPLFEIASIALVTGARRGEICGISWADLDFEKKTLHIRRSVEETKAHGVRINRNPKNKNSKRKIPIDPKSIELMTHFKAGQIEEYKKMGFDPTEEFLKDCLVFPRRPESPKEPMIPMYVTHKFSKVAKALGFKTLRFHDLRHTSATLLLEAGLNIHTVAQRLGNTAAVICSTYGHVTSRNSEEAVRISESALRDALAPLPSKTAIEGPGEKA